jgi:lipopolysaccharide export system permease protein
MRILEKYIVRDFIAAFLFCISLLIVLGVIGDILGFLDDIFKNNIPLGSILAFYIYLAPFAFVNMAPFACLLSAVYVFNTLSKNQEITAVIASGVSLWKLLKPVLFVTVILSLLTFLVNDRIVPSTMEKANAIRKSELEKGSGDQGAAVKNIAIYGDGGSIIFAKSYTPKTKTINDLIIHKHAEDKSVKEKLCARIVRWNGSGWTGEDVMIFQVTPEGDFIGDPQVYKKTDIAMAEKPKDFISNQWDPRFMSYRQLIDYIKAFRDTSPNTVRRLFVELHYKFAFPFTALVMVLIGVPFSIETGRSNALIGMAKGITAAMFYLPVMACVLALGKGGTIQPWVSAWLSIAVFSVAGAIFINKKS